MGRQTDRIFIARPRLHSVIHITLLDCVCTVFLGNSFLVYHFYILPITRTRLGESGFFYSGPAAWNTLPSDLHDITDTSTFRKRLNDVLFTALHGMQTRSSDENSVCPSVKRVHCDKTEERSS